MKTNETKSNRTWWIVGFLVVLLIAGTICCLATLVTGGSMLAWVVPQVQSTLVTMTEEARQPARSVTELAPALPSPPSPTPTPPAATNFTNNDGRSESPSAAVDAQGNLHIIWFDDSLRQADSGGADILHRYLTANGDWSDVSNVTEGFEVMQMTTQLLTTTDGRPCAYWMGSQPFEFGVSAYLRCWSNGQWEETQKQDLGDDFGIHQSSPAFTPDGSLEVAYAAMNEWRLHDQPILPSSDYVYNLKFMIDTQGGYHLLWEQGEPDAIWHRYSQDQGQTWSEAEQVTGSEQAPYGSSNLVTSTDGLGNVHLVWGGSNGAYYRWWKPNSGWQAAEKVLAMHQFVGEMALAVDLAGQPHLAFGMVINGPPALGYTQRNADGKWSSPQLIAIAAQGESLFNGQLCLVIDSKGQRHFIWPVFRFGGDFSHSDLYYTVLP